jgi:hypothetical protein
VTQGCPVLPRAVALTVLSPLAAVLLFAGPPPADAESVHPQAPSGPDGQDRV